MTADQSICLVYRTRQTRAASYWFDINAPRICAVSARERCYSIWWYSITKLKWTLNKYVLWVKWIWHWSQLIDFLSLVFRTRSMKQNIFLQLPFVPPNEWTSLLPSLHLTFRQNYLWWNVLGFELKKNLIRRKILNYCQNLLSDNLRLNIAPPPLPPTSDQSPIIRNNGLVRNKRTLAATNVRYYE